MRKREIRVLGIRPTQFAVGIMEVRAKVHVYKRLGRKKLERELQAKRIPVVISPRGRFYATDHHHHLFACLLVGVKKVPVEIHQDLRSHANTMGFGKFWRYMVSHGFAHLYDQFGQGPRSALYLPEDVRGMADDPYRSLAWAVREAGGYEASGQLFCEFAWAEFFRARKLLDREGRDGIRSAVGRGVRLARSRAARGLPGFAG
jgi:hypothetical protein